MRKIKEVLRLRFELGLGLRAIARSCSIGLGTAHEYLQRAEAAGVAWPLGEDWDEDRLEAALFGGPPRPRPVVRPLPDFAVRGRTIENSCGPLRAFRRSLPLICSLARSCLACLSRARAIGSSLATSTSGCRTATLSRPWRKCRITAAFMTVRRALYV